MKVVLIAKLLIAKLNDCKTTVAVRYELSGEFYCVTNGILAQKKSVRRCAGTKKFFVTDFRFDVFFVLSSAEKITAARRVQRMIRAPLVLPTSYERSANLMQSSSCEFLFSKIYLARLGKVCLAISTRK